ncbi:UDP-glucose 4-epimerase GalE [Gammaproteobacteria bacterium 45_16_T64]|nr:UDP-glucose 4-epimerase GalE [Gammaproteobacteria bacterium 45_16_T64]
MTGSILVTGGAGYIGSHLVRQLGERKEKVIVLDNLSTGFEESVLYGELVIGDTGDEALVSQLIKTHNIETVIHFAAHTIVPESVENPLKYYKNNTANTRTLLECCKNGGVKNFIFSSTAAVYGEPEESCVSETTPTQPINPYGMSKLMSEHMIRDLSASSELNHVILRYFNVAGCEPHGRIGQKTKNATLLTKVAVEAAVGKRDKVLIFGTDFDTPDGTGIRDYIHVEDLASAHIKALDYLNKEQSSLTVNAGYGHGYSVREVLEMVMKVNGARFTIEEVDRRAGDPPALTAKADKIKEFLGWVPEHDNLEAIVTSALNWEKHLLTLPPSE